MTNQTRHPDETRSAEQAAPEALIEAASAAGHAPSTHNTQPWAWRVLPDHMELHADRSRHLAATDPAGRMLTISCGTALHHAVVALAAQGWAAAVRRLPDPTRPDLLATVTTAGAQRATAQTLRLREAMRIRQTDREPAGTEPVPPGFLAAVTAAVAGQARLHILTHEQVLELAAAASRAGEAEAADPQIRAEIEYWTSRAAPAGTGMPATVLPSSETHTAVPNREFGRIGTRPAAEGHDQAASYAVLFGDDDEPVSWLRAGEALSAAWLTAVDHGLSVLPLSAAVELDTARTALRHILAGLGYPYLVLRLGTVDIDHAAPARTPRLPQSQVIDTSAT